MKKIFSASLLMLLTQISFAQQKADSSRVKNKKKFYIESFIGALLVTNPQPPSGYESVMFANNGVHFEITGDCMLSDQIDLMLSFG